MQGKEVDAETIERIRRVSVKMPVKAVRKLTRKLTRKNTMKMLTIETRRSSMQIGQNTPGSGLLLSDSPLKSELSSVAEEEVQPHHGPPYKRMNIFDFKKNDDGIVSSKASSLSDSLKSSTESDSVTDSQEDFDLDDQGLEAIEEEEIEIGSFSAKVNSKLSSKLSKKAIVSSPLDAPTTE